MKPDMKISLLFDVIEGHQEKSTFMALRQVFAYRLLDFFNTHPEVIATALLLLVLVLELVVVLIIPTTVCIIVIMIINFWKSYLEMLKDHLNTTMREFFKMQLLKNV